MGAEAPIVVGAKVPSGEPEDLRLRLGESVPEGGEWGLVIP